MFEQLLSRDAYILRYCQGPYPEQRQRYLSLLMEEGRSRTTLRAICALLYSMAPFLPWSGPVTSLQVEGAAVEWSKTRRFSSTHAKSAKRWFVYHATNWFRLLGRLHEPAAVQPFQDELEALIQFETRERGLSPATILNRRCFLPPFLTWLSGQVQTLASVAPEHIVRYFANTAEERHWKRTTISLAVCVLRAFFRFAESQRWCRQGLAATIAAPRMYSLERLPRGPAWNDVQRLIKASKGEAPRDIRDHAILLLLTIYGLRSGEVRLLRLEDLDWEQETILIRRSKQRKTERYPLVREAGDAILRYLRKVRPPSRHREVFLSLRQPSRLLTAGGFGTMVAQRMRRLGLDLPFYGPHTLRHACATHLLHQGFSLKEIGDHLGHVSPVATQIYAKVDLDGLREVGQLNLRKLVAYAGTSARKITPLHKRSDIAALRVVGEIGLGGLL
jgi:site-specific recombinase XerD